MATARPIQIFKTPVSATASVYAPNRAQQHFVVAKLNDDWVSDITHIRKYEGWLYRAVILDLSSRRIIGWSLQARIKKGAGTGCSADGSVAQKTNIDPNGSP